MANTGYKAWNTLEQYNTATGAATGTTKANVSSDPDYVAPIYDTSSCPISDTTPPTIGNLTVTSFTNRSVSLGWGAPSDASGIDRQEVWHNMGGSGTYSLLATLNATASSYTANSLTTNNTHFFYVRAYDIAGNYINTNTVNQHIVTESLTVSPSYLYYTSNGGTQTVTVTSSTAWTTTQTGHGVSPSSGNAGTTYVDIIKFSNGGGSIIYGTVNFNASGVSRTVNTEQAASGGGGFEQA